MFKKDIFVEDNTMCKYMANIIGVSLLLETHGGETRASLDNTIFQKKLDFE